MRERQSVFEASPRRVRVYFNRQLIGDSKAMMVFHEAGRLPIYYFPKEDVCMKYLQPSGATSNPQPKGQGVYWHIQVGEKHAENAAFTFRNPPSGEPNLQGYIAFQWDQMDAWFEEDEEVFVHARDPYTRVDVLNSSRYVKIVVDDVLVAETRRPRLLFETGLPTRYYIPAQDTRMELLEQSTTVTHCPYKGEAHYYSVRAGEALHKDLVWYYRYPIPECPKIEGLLCFFNERVDIYEDGALLTRPKSPWS
ncbi:MAG: DUF427 domain-containing protein [Acidiferrobacterales bacterium]